MGTFEGSKTTFEDSNASFEHALGTIEGSKPSFECSKESFEGELSSFECSKGSFEGSKEEFEWVMVPQWVWGKKKEKEFFWGWALVNVFYPVQNSQQQKTGQIAKLNPIDKNQLDEIKGFGSWRMDNFGKDIIRVLDGLR